VTSSMKVSSVEVEMDSLEMEVASESLTGDFVR
jgi:hypothetical protein